MKDNLKSIKIWIIGSFTVLWSALGILAIPILILVVTNIIDFFTGLTASKYRNQKINSCQSSRGIIKKICMWLLIVVGALVDWLILSTAGSVGIVLPFTYAISIVVTVWLITNEIISILENMVDIGVDMPPFLMPLVKNIRKQVEDKTEIKGGE